MNKRVYGVIGVAAYMANWNADFSGFPKTTESGTIFGSDKALKYPMKKIWELEGEKVLYIKSMKFNDKKDKENTLIPRTLKERYEQIFEIEDMKKDKDMKVVLENLFKAIDVKNFGATFAEEKMNIAITGAVQFGQGLNKYKESEVVEQQILSPFRDAKDNDAKNSTLGTKIVSEEAHYFYPFNINPLAYKGYKELEVTDGYTEEDYKKFKEVAISSATAFSTNAKEGCENEFAVFVETDEKLYLPNLTKYVEFEKAESNIITVELAELLNSFEDRIKSVEIYYDKHTTELKFNGEIKGMKVYDINTRKEV